tara:strand:+ start:512 stop:727 length:216 start_codon:yes stop_codon:yes gene_type:complete
MRKLGVIIFVVYVVFGIYFFNLGAEVYEVPEKISQYDKIIFLVGGVLIILGGINYFRARRHVNPLLYPGFS